MFRILVAEDDDNARFLMCEVLRRAGYEPCPARDGVEALEVMEHYQCDLAVVDITMPRMDGITFTQTLREGNCNLPVLMVTARVTQEDKRRGFRAGTDDYMVKPFDFRELNARISILLKRCQIPTVECIEYADLKVYLRTKSVSRNGQSIILTPKEYNLLLFFVQNPERILTRTEIAEKVWDTHFDTGTNFIDVYINYLRKKIDKNFNTKLIHTKPGMGFIFSYENPY